MIMSELLVRRKFPQPVDQAQVDNDWRARGFGCDLFVDPPGQEWNNFTHSTNELVMVVEGRLEMKMLGETYEMDAGDEIYIPKDALHSVKNIHSGITRWLFGYD